MAPPKRTRTIYATINRVTGRAPMIQLKPVTYSLTDGTDIPAPSLDPTPPPTPPPLATVPESPVDISNGYGDHTRTLSAESAGTEPMPKLTTTDLPADPDANGAAGGPLSSNPVTPTEASIHNQPQPPQSHRDSVSSAFRIPRKQIPNPRPASTHLNGYHNHPAYYGGSASSRPDSSVITHPSEKVAFDSRPATAAGVSRVGTFAALPDQPPPAAQRRPSFIERFFRRRGRVSSDASTSSITRGTKRPASPWSANDYGMPEEQQRAGSFPRTLRKKSMELISGSARRMSGMWSRSDPAQEAMEQEREMEMRREEEERREMEEREREEELRREDEERRRIIEEEIMARPPPTLPGLREGSIDGGRVDAKELWSIGKE